MKIKPTANNVLIRPLGNEKTKSGIYLAKEQKSQRAKVVAVGKYILPDGTEGVPDFKVGDTIIHKKWEGQEIKLDISKEPLVFIKHEAVLAVEGKGV